MILEIKGKALQFDVGMLKRMRDNAKIEDPLKALEGLSGFTTGERIYVAGRQRYNEKRQVISEAEIIAEMDELEMKDISYIINEFTRMVKGDNTSDDANVGTGEKKE